MTRRGRQGLASRLKADGKKIRTIYYPVQKEKKKNSPGDRQFWGLIGKVTTNPGALWRLARVFNRNDLTLLLRGDGIEVLAVG